MRFFRLPAVAGMLAITLLVAAVPFATPTAANATVTTADLHAVKFVSATVGVAVAANGQILRSTDGGTTWAQVRAADTYSFRGVDFWDANNGVAVDHGGLVALTSNGGVTWSNVVFTAPWVDMDRDDKAHTHKDVAVIPGTTTSAVAAAGYPTPSNDEDVAAAAWRTTGGMDFANWKSPASAFENRLRDDGHGTVYEAGKGETRDIEFVDGSVGWAAGVDYFTVSSVPYTTSADRPILYKTVDGASNWTEVKLAATSPAVRLEGVAFSGTSAGIVVGSASADFTRRAYHTTNGGTTWAASTLPAGAQLRAVDMASAASGWAVGDGGVILRTTDGGANWTACNVTGAGGNTLYDVQVLPGTTMGWAVGASGTILLTTDGLNWAVPSTPADTTPPSAPSGLAGTATSSSAVSLTWNASTDTGGSGLAGYTVYRNGTEIGTTGSTSYTATGLAASTSYAFTVRARDVAGNLSAASNTANVTTLAAPVTPKLDPVFRFYNTSNGTHFYSPSVTERDEIIRKYPAIYSYEGIAYSMNTAANTQPLYRFYNKRIGSHFLTASAAERDDIIRKYPAIYTYEGESYKVSPVKLAGSLTVYRFYNNRNGTHFFTASEAEKNDVIAKYPHVYTFEGPAYYIAQ